MNYTRVKKEEANPVHAAERTTGKNACRGIQTKGKTRKKRTCTCEGTGKLTGQDEEKLAVLRREGGSVKGKKYLFVTEW